MSIVSKSNFLYILNNTLQSSLETGCWHNRPRDDIYISTYILYIYMYINLVKDWSQFLFASLHEEITSIRLYTRCNPRSVLRKGWTTWLGLFRMNRTNNFDLSLYINSNFFCYDIEKYIYFFKIRQIIGNKFK